MSWRTKFRLRQYWMGSLWILPTVMTLFASLLAQTMQYLDKSFHDRAWLQYESGTAITILGAFLAASITFTGFVFTMLLLVPQFAGSQLSTRVLHLQYRDVRIKFLFGLFTANTVYFFVLLMRMRGGFVPGLSLWVGGVLFLVSVHLFLAFVSYFVQRLRPATAAEAVARIGQRVNHSLYRERGAAGSSQSLPLPDRVPDHLMQEVRHTGTGGVILAIGIEGMLRLAEASNCVIHVTHAVGEHVSEGSVIARVQCVSAPVEERQVGALIAVGTERTFEQDPVLALRILVDIAVKALSSSINDPTTAVSVIDHIEDLLEDLAHCDLAVGTIRDQTGKVRVTVPSPTWPAFLYLATTELRLYCGGSLNVARRLHTMLRNLRERVPQDYIGDVDAELERLEQTIDSSFPLEADRMLARSLATLYAPTWE